MSDIQIRLVFKKLDQNAEIKKLIVFLQKHTDFSEEIIKGMLSDPPRVLLTGSNSKELKTIQASLKKMGCLTIHEQIKTDVPFPFPVTLKNYKIIKQELSKTQRSKGSLALFLLHLEAVKSQAMLPSMMGSFGERLLGQFRESDTVIGIDDSRLILIGFATGRENIEIIKEKTVDGLADFLEEEANISIGVSLFPEEGRSVSKLLEIAESKRKMNEPSEKMEQKSADTPYVLSRDDGSLTPIQVCFTEARGKMFKRLLSMDPQSLLLGLSQLPIEKQQEFLARLPFDSPLTPILQDAIDTQSQPVPDKASEEDLETILYYMGMEEGLEERKNNQEKILSKLNRTEALPTLPSVASHVLMIASNPDASASDLTNVIENDPSLTSKLLKVVNSAFYGFLQKIGTVKQAVVLLGTGEIIALAFGLTTAKLFNVSQLKGIYSPKSLWQHSMCTGLIAENLCKRFPEYKKLGVFTAGLLHDFGKILLIENFSDLYGQVHAEAKKYSLPLFELEEEKFGLNHAIIGEFLATNWNLPDALIQAVAFHHQPFSAPSHSQLAAIIGLADFLYYEAVELGEISMDFSGFSCELTSCHWTLLGQLFPGFNSEMLKEMTQDAVEIINKSMNLFAIPD
ncbi:MAG: HDOD domain-containing protein [Deltaproteobacteria bacterium]|nr:HDOD domain-containing protein [Deltaproteobacteria bacterium]